MRPLDACTQMDSLTFSFHDRIDWIRDNARTATVIKNGGQLRCHYLWPELESIINGTLWKLLPLYSDGQPTIFIFGFSPTPPRASFQSTISANPGTVNFNPLYYFINIYFNLLYWAHLHPVMSTLVLFFWGGICDTKWQNFQKMNSLGGRQLDNWGGPHIHIFVVAEFISFEIKCFYGLWTRMYEYVPPPIKLGTGLW